MTKEEIKKYGDKLLSDIKSLAAELDDDLVDSAALQALEEMWNNAVKGYSEDDAKPDTYLYVETFCWYKSFGMWLPVIARYDEKDAELLHKDPEAFAVSVVKKSGYNVVDESGSVNPDMNELFSVKWLELDSKEHYSKLLNYFALDDVDHCDALVLVSDGKVQTVQLEEVAGEHDIDEERKIYW